MTGRRGGARLVVVGWLRIDCGQQARGIAWVRYPAADYRCGHCGTYEAASGDQVPHFTATVRDRHRETCPHHRKEQT